MIDWQLNKHRFTDILFGEVSLFVSIIYNTWCLLYVAIHVTIIDGVDVVNVSKMDKNLTQEDVEPG